MKLEVGMYVRSNNNFINKIIAICPDREKPYVFKIDDEHCEVYGYKENQIKKASHNIIDLIEEGDYVNGKLVSSLPLLKNEFIFGKPVNGVKYIKGIIGTPVEDNKGNFIKSIVTKEQFSSMEYKIND